MVQVSLRVGTVMGISGYGYPVICIRNRPYGGSECIWVTGLVIKVRLRSPCALRQVHFCSLRHAPLGLFLLFGQARQLLAYLAPLDL